MPRRLIKKHLPDPDHIRNSKPVRLFGKRLHDPNLWHINRRSVSGAFALGLFAAFVPIPFQMALAAGFAILFRVNLPISVALVWISNPLTMGPLFIFCYHIGTGFIGGREQPLEFQLSIEWLTSEMGAIWQPFVLGCFIVGTAAAILGYIGVRIVWRILIVRRLTEKRQKKPVNP